MSVGQVVLEWDANYATGYTIQISSDNNTWTTVFGTSSGDGANDTISFSPVSARYVKLESTAWSNNSQRVWLRELEVYSGGSGPMPTPTPVAPTPTPTDSPPPTATATPGPIADMHVGDLDGTSNPGNRNRWEATVTITVHDANENPVSGATASGTWSGGVSGGSSCVTDNTGACSLARGNIKRNVSSVVFTIDAVSHNSLQYQPSANHDPDGDSNGTSISVVAP
jgi:hypothetical protein